MSGRNGGQFTTIGHIAWPAAIAYGVYTFRDEIAKLLPNLKFKHNETELSFRKEIQEEAQPRVETGLSTAVQSANSPTAGPYKALPEAAVKLPSVENLRTLIHEQLQSYDPNEHINILVREVAIAQVAMGFETVFADIFDSQLRFLRLLHARKEVDISEANTFFENTARANYAVLADWDVHKWLNYLIRFKMIEDLGGRIKITDLGSDFLTYVDVSKSGYLKSL